MATFTRFDRYKLHTDFLDGSYQHTILGSPARIETWKRLEQLGEGSFGTVHRERCEETGALRAVKEIRKRLAKSNEIDVLMQLRSYPAHFVQLSGWFEDRLNIYLAMEYLECGDLGSLMKEEDLTENDARTITAQVLDGLEIMHKNQLCHRDLKPGNILIARWMPLTVKIADFGVSKHFDGTEGQTFAGSQHYMAPEIWGILPDSDSSRYTTAVDVWSLGCMVYAMLTKAPPFPDPRRLIEFVEGRIAFPPGSAQDVSASAVDFMTALLMPFPHDRATADKARLHPWISVEQGEDTVWSMLPKRQRRVDLSVARVAQDVSVSVGGSTDRTLINPDITVYESGIRRTSSSSSSSSPGVQLPPVKRYAAVPAAQDVPVIESARRGPKEDAMIAAAASGNVTLVRSMLEKGADIYSYDYRGRTAIGVAALGNNRSCVELLLEHGAPINQRSSEGLTPLLFAAQGGHFSLVQHLISRGADVMEISNDSYTALYFAAQGGSLDCVKFFYKHGVDIKQRAKNGQAPLHAAADNGHMSVVKYLLQQGEDVMEEVEDGKTPLDYAVLSGHLDVCKFLVKSGAQVKHRDHKEGHSALDRAAEKGDLRLVTYLAEQGADTNEATSNGRFPIYYAAYSKNIELVRFLLQKGADANCRSSEGITVLHRAAESGYVPMISYLLDEGADITAIAKDGRGSMFLGAFSGNLKACEFLLSKGADTKTRTASRMTFLHAAARAGHVEIISLALSQGFGVEERTSHGYTALHFAAQYAKLETVQFLLSRGSDVTATTDSGATALSLAGERGHTQMVTYLLEAVEGEGEAASAPTGTPLINALSLGVMPSRNPSPVAPPPAGYTTDLAPRSPYLEPSLIRPPPSPSVSSMNPPHTPEPPENKSRLRKRFSKMVIDWFG